MLLEISQKAVDYYGATRVLNNLIGIKMLLSFAWIKNIPFGIFFVIFLIYSLIDSILYSFWHQFLIHLLTVYKNLHQ